MEKEDVDKLIEMIEKYIDSDYNQDYLNEIKEIVKDEPNETKQYVNYAIKRLLFNKLGTNRADIYKQPLFD